MNLGVAHHARIVGDLAENQDAAMHFFRHALDSRDRQSESATRIGASFS
jgi:hypothetical protein